VLIVLAPEIGPAIAIALVLATKAWFFPRSFVGIALILVVLSAVLSARLPDTTASLIDEIVICVGLITLPLLRVARGGLPIVPAWSLWFVGFAGDGIYSALLNEVPTALVLQGGFLAIKAVLFGVMTAQVDWRPEDLRPFAIGGATAILTIFAACIVNLIAPEWWTSVLLGAPIEFTGEFGLPALIGWFSHPAALGRISVLLASAALTYHLYVKGTWRTTVLFGMATLMSLVTFRVKTIVSLLTSLGIIGFVNIRKIPRPVIVVALALLAVAAFPLLRYVADDVQQYLLSRSARSLLTYGAIDVAERQFPWGAGFGRYGSYTASAYYSPEYRRLDFESEYGMGSEPGRGQFLNDTQWPAILGEAGWVGALLFVGGILHIGARYLGRPTGEAPPEAWVRMTGLAWLVIVVVESIGAPVFTSPPSFPLPFFAAGVYLALQRAKELPPQNSQITRSEARIRSEMTRWPASLG